MEYRIFREKRREVYRIKKRIEKRPSNMFFPWLFPGYPEKWVWVTEIETHEDGSWSEDPREFATRELAEQYIVDQIPDKWEEI